MSIEHSMPFELHDEVWGGLRRHLEGSAAYHLLSGGPPHTILLRFVDGVQRQSWPEDVALVAADGVLVISFHAGTRAQRTTVLTKVQSYLRGQGIEGSFEEL